MNKLTTKDLITGVIFVGIGVAVGYEIRNGIDDYHIKQTLIQNEYTGMDLEMAMHIAILNNDSKIASKTYFEFESGLDFRFWEENSKYILQKDVIDNLDNLKIKVVDSKEDDRYLLKSKDNCVGYYDERLNKIVILANNSKYATTSHELMHFLSQGGYRKKELSVINEVITELMARAYSNISVDNNCRYELNFDYVIPLIEVLGIDIIRETYFSKNDKKLIEEINKYTDNYRELIFEINYLSDNVCEYRDYLKGSSYNEELVSSYKVFLEDYWNNISEIYKNKYNKDIRENNRYNYYMIHSGLNNSELYNISLVGNIVDNDYNPFSSEYLSIFIDGKRYDVDINGTTYTIYQYNNGNTTRDALEENKQKIKR